MKKYVLLLSMCLCLVGCQIKEEKLQKHTPEATLEDSTTSPESQNANKIETRALDAMADERENDSTSSSKDSDKSEESNALNQSSEEQLGEVAEEAEVEVQASVRVSVSEEGKTIAERFPVPEGYVRVELEDASFGAYLRNLPLKEHGSKVLYYDGRKKNRHQVYLAVVDMDIGKRDLQQCADAIMRLRGEYLYHQGNYDKIHFNFTNGFRVDYSKWMAGYRVKIEGNKTSYVKSKGPSNTYKDFRKYMDLIFAYAGTLSLAAELEEVPLLDMTVGNVLIQGGSPGHAVIVVDMAVHEKTGDVVYMLAQSYMPAQETQVLCNPSEADSPWYKLEACSQLRTPEWTFTPNDLKGFVLE